MDGKFINMDKIREVIKSTLKWVGLLDRPPVTWIAEDRIRVATSRRPLLEFGFHAWGSACDVQVGDHHVRSLPGTILVLNAHFGNRGTPTEAWRYWCMSLDVEAMSPIQGLARAPFLCWDMVRDSTPIIERYRAVAQEYRRPGPTGDVRLKSSVLLLLSELYESLGSTDPDVTVYSPPVENAIHFLTTHFPEPELRLSDMANAAHLSPAHFGRIFRAEVGIPPMKYLTQLRMEHARRMLDRTRLQVGEIGGAVGYEDNLHFSRTFRAHMGISPRQYRKKR